MRNLLPGFLGIYLLSATGCTTPPAEESTPEPSPVQYSQSYLPPVFKDEERTDKIRQALAESHHYYAESAALHHLPGVSYGLVVDDSLVFYGGCGNIDMEKGLPVSEKSLFRIASMTKSFTAMAILKLRDEGKLSLSDPAVKYIPELKDLNYLAADAPSLSIFNLLTMTAGFPEDNPWGDRFLDIGDKELMEQVDRGITFSTVTSLHYEYSNLGFGLLGNMISRVSGIPYQEYITRNILQPLGMTHTYWEYDQVPRELLALGYRWEDSSWDSEPHLHDGAFGAMGGLITSIEDFSKYVSFHLSAWPPRSDTEKGPLKRSTIREMHRMNNPRFYSDPMRFGSRSAPIMRGYGFGLVVMKDHKGIIEVGHNGGLPGFGSSYMFYPQYGIGIMAFSNLTYVGGRVRTVNYMVIKQLIQKGLFIPRELPVSDILVKRKEQITQLIRSWDPLLEEEIVAANLYLDISREKRMKEVKELLDIAGEIISVGPVIPENQLRGSYIIEGSARKLEVFFTLTPEVAPRVQWLTLKLLDEE